MWNPRIRGNWDEFNGGRFEVEILQTLELVLVAIVLIALGIALFFAELETDEAEFFGPAAIFFLIVGSAVWFFSGPSGTLLA